MNHTVRILIAEHDISDVEMLYHELKTGGINYISEVVQTEKDYINSLKHFIPDIILADYTFPSFDGITAFKAREQLAPATPFIFVSGTIGEERSIELIRTGVTDYVLKDNLASLNHKIVRALSEAKAKQEKKETEQALIESERRLVMAQQMAHIGNWELNFASNGFKCSDETFRIYGQLPVQNILSFEFVSSFIHPEDVHFVLCTVQDSRHLPQGFSITYRIVRPNGSVRNVYAEGKPEYDQDGNANGFYGIVQDVTEMILLENKIAIEKQLRQKEITNAVLTAQENERTNIGNELNENLNQILAAAKVYLHLSGKNSDKRQMYLDMSSGFIDDVMAAIRKISHTLVIPSAHIISLVDNIKNLVNELSFVHPLKIKFRQVDIETGALDEKLQMTIYRIIQEQINNILLHSNATRARIYLGKIENEILLCISDNGEGCDVLKENSGVGIINIKTRAELYDGSVVIISEPGSGYELKVALSLNTNTSKLKTGKSALE